jgi:hypothetical protein
VDCHSDESLFVVDLGDGFLEGMHLRKAVKVSARGSTLAKHMLYTLGRTLWGLWIDDFPPEEEAKEAPDTLLIRALVDNCCLGSQFKTVIEVKEAYFSSLLEMVEGSITS